MRFNDVHLQPRDSLVGITRPTFLGELCHHRPELSEISAWLHRDGFDPEPLLAAVSARLQRRGRHLPEKQRHEYYASVLLNEFLTRWVRRNSGSRVQDWIVDNEIIDEDAVDKQLRPFELALVLLCDAGAFKKQVPKLIRESEAKRSYIHYGDGDGFAGYVAGTTWLLANRMLRNFNPARRNASRCAINYLLKTAMSCYLKHRSEDPDYATSGMLGYLKRSRIDRRNVVAYKLVYCPTHLSFEERRWLREAFSWTDLTQRMRVSDAAHLLGYKNAAALSRKLYKMRGWAKFDVMADAVAGEAL